MSGDIKFNQSSLRYLHDFNRVRSGNAHILICAFLRYSVENDARREIKATFNLALSFLSSLRTMTATRDLIFQLVRLKH